MKSIPRLVATGLLIACSITPSALPAQSPAQERELPEVLVRNQKYLDCLHRRLTKIAGLVEVLKPGEKPPTHLVPGVCGNLKSDSVVPPPSGGGGVVFNRPLIISDFSVTQGQAACLEAATPQKVDARVRFADCHVSPLPRGRS